MTALTAKSRLGANQSQFWRLVRNLTGREIRGKYQGSLLGIAWTVLNPLLMLALYTFVFTVIFKARWTTQGDVASYGTFDFAIILFAGLIMHAFLADILSIAPKSMLSNRNYVKKVVFPLHALPVVLTGTALFHLAIKLLVLVVFIFTVRHSVPITALYAPLICVPLVIIALGLAYIVSALGVYLRDITQLMPQIVTALLFLGPILYSSEAAPAPLRPFLMFNPLAVPVEQLRRATIFGQQPEWHLVGIHALVSLGILLAGYWIFKALKRGFADVV